MNFTKSELQSIRKMVSNELSTIEHLIRVSGACRKDLFAVSDKEDPDTHEAYNEAKRISNFNKSIRATRVEKITLLKKVKEMIQIADGKIPKNHMQPKNKFFSWVRGE